MGLVKKPYEIENFRNYVKYSEEPKFVKFSMINKMHYTVYYNTKTKVERVQSFCSKRSRTENRLTI